MDAAPSSLPSSSTLAVTSPFRGSVSISPPSSSIHHTLLPFPPLPMELKREILRFCDPSTLAKTSRVSLAFLEMSSPLLYNDVFIGDVHRLASLFCQRDHLAQPQLESYLSLGQIKHFTYLPTRTLYTSAESVKALEPVRPLEVEKLRGLRTDRFPPPPTPTPSSPRTLPLDTLTVQLRGKVGILDYPEIFYSLFNPTACKIEGLAPGFQDHVPLSNIPLSDWSRLSHLTVKSAKITSVLWNISSLKPKLVITHDLTEADSNVTSMLSRWEVAQTLVGRWRAQQDRLVVGEMPKVRVMVGRESEKAQFLRELDTDIRDVAYVFDLVGTDALEHALKNLSVLVSA